MRFALQRCQCRLNIPQFAPELTQRHGARQDRTTQQRAAFLLCERVPSLRVNALRRCCSGLPAAASLKPPHTQLGPAAGRRRMRCGSRKSRRAAGTAVAHAGQERSRGRHSTALSHSSAIAGLARRGQRHPSAALAPMADVSGLSRRVHHPPARAARLPQPTASEQLGGRGAPHESAPPRPASPARTRVMRLPRPRVGERGAAPAAFAPAEVQQRRRAQLGPRKIPLSDRFTAPRIKALRRCASPCPPRPTSSPARAARLPRPAARERGGGTAPAHGPREALAPTKIVPRRSRPQAAQTSGKGPPHPASTVRTRSAGSRGRPPAKLMRLALQQHGHSRRRLARARGPAHAGQKHVAGGHSAGAFAPRPRSRSGAPAQYSPPDVPRLARGVPPHPCARA